MSELYDLTRRVLDAKTLEEASDVFYNDGESVERSRMFYQNIISNFIMRKDTVLPKIGGIVRFDLDSNIEDVWSIVFVGQYVISKLTEEQDILRKELNKAKSKKGQVTDAQEKVEIEKRIVELREKSQLINKVIANLATVADLRKIEVDSSASTLTGPLVEDSVNKLKEAIAIFEKIRNTLEHNDGKTKVGEVVSFNNDNYPFVVDIPIKYLDGFSKGRIIANEGDKIIVQRVNSIVTPIFEELDYDIKKLSNFFYNVSPSRLDYLLTRCNNDVTLLHQLPGWAFYEKGNALLDIISNNEKVFSPNTVRRISLIKSAPLEVKKGDIVEDYPMNLKRLYDYIKKYVKERGYPEDYDVILLNHVFGTDFNIDVDNVIECLELFKKYDMNPFLYNNGLFSRLNPNIIQQLINVYGFNENVVNFIYNKKYFELSSLEEILMYYGFYYNNGDINDCVLEMPHLDREMTLEDQSQLIPIAINHYKSSPKPDILLFKRICGLDISDGFTVDNFVHLLNDSIKRHGRFSSIDTFVLDEYRRSIKIFDYNRIMKITDFFYEMVKDYELFNFQIILIVKLSENYNLVLDDEMIKKLAYLQDNGLTWYYLSSSIDTEFEKLLVSYLKDPAKDANLVLDYDYKKPSEGREVLLLSDLDTIKNFTEQVLEPPIYREVMVGLSNRVSDYITYEREIKDERLKFSFRKIMIDRLDKIRELLIKNKDVNYSKAELKKIINYSYFNIELINNLKNYLGDNVSLERYLRYLEDRFDYVDTVIEANPDAFSMFYNEAQLAKPYYSKRHLTPSIRNFDFLTRDNSRNIEYLLERVNGDYSKLSEFPSEFLHCKFEVLPELLKLYNYNISRSLFGTDNPKIISSLVYANSVLSNFNSNDCDFDIDVNRLIHECFNDTYRYRHVMNNPVVTPASYFSQFFEDIHAGLADRSTSNHVITKFRDAVAHNRFKPVRDYEGNVVENLIYLYDQDNQGNNNFNIIIDINSFVELVNDIEMKMSKTKTL